MSTGDLPFVSDDGTISLDLGLPESLREKLARPAGSVSSEDGLSERLAGCGRLISVGDMVTVTLVKNGLIPDIAVIDYRTRRGPCDRKSREILSGMQSETVRVENPAGVITADLWNAIARAMRHTSKTKIEVAGEEDLAALACIELADKGDCVIYGIPNQGISTIRIDEEIKREIRAVLGQMTRRSQ